MTNIGIIGAGRIGHVHAKTIGSIADANLVLVSDVNEDAAKALAEKYGARYTTRAEDVFADKEVEAIIICSPTPLHVEHIVAAAKAGKPALCEKPLAMEVESVAKLKEQLKGLNPTVMLGFNRRFDPNFAKIKKLVDEGKIGPLEQLTIISRDPAAPPKEYIAVSGGIFKDMTIHDFDMAHYFLGDVATVTTIGQNLDPDLDDTGDYDAAVILLTNKAGKVATIINSRHCATGYDQRLEAFGPKGSLFAENQRETTVRAYTAEYSDAQEPFQDFFLTRYATAYADELRTFLEAVKEGKELQPSIEAGEVALRIAEAALESAKTGKTVKL